MPKYRARTPYTFWSFSCKARGAHKVAGTVRLPPERTRR